MPQTIRALAISLALAVPSLAATSGHAAPTNQTSIATNSPEPLSVRVVDYTIDAHIDPARHTLDATETLTYRNLTGRPLRDFPFHLYLNAFQPDSTFTTETHNNGGIRDSLAESAYPARKLGAITLTKIEAENYGPLTPHFTSPDDGNPHDRTVALVTLPRDLPPGVSITFHITFHDLFPESVARNGYKRDFLMGGQWYPKLGVFWHGAWNCHQYHANTEFFSDFATFNVALTLPRNLIVGASGVPTASRQNPDGTRTDSFYAEDIHDFAWAVSPNFYATDATYQSSMGPVLVHVLALRTHPKAGQRYLSILLASLAQFDHRYGPYPYKILTLIDPEPGSEIGGMEYPTLITGDTSNFDPTHLTEITAEHEFGHQYWYGMVATNEFEDAWLDEGINAYTESIVTAAILGSDKSAIAFPWASASDLSLLYNEYIVVPAYDPVTRHAWLFRNANSYSGITYGKSAMILHTLEGLLGQDTMDEAMRTYFQRFRFTHPTTEDFLSTIEEVARSRGRITGTIAPDPIPLYQLLVDSSTRKYDGTIRKYDGTGPTHLPADPAPHLTLMGSSLRPFLQQAVYGTATLDYAIDSVSSTPEQWWLPTPSPQLTDTVTVHRIGDFTLPVTIEIIFSDKTRTRVTWDGGTGNTVDPERFHTFTFHTTASIVSAEIDPDHTVPLDLDQFNNSKTVASNPVPARKLTNLWLSTLQLSSQLAGWLI